MAAKNIRLTAVSILSAAAFAMLCGSSGFYAPEAWQRFEAPPAPPVVEPEEEIPVIASVTAEPPVVPSVEVEEVVADYEPVVEVCAVPGNVFSTQASDGSPVAFQLQYLPTRQAYVFDHDRKVYGLALGYYLPQAEIYGVSLSLMHVYNVRKYGLSFSILEMSGEIGGLTVFLAGGAVSNYGLALGLINMTENNHGMQFGLVNIDEKDLLLDYPQKPHEEGEESGFGIQAGLINFSDSRGIQFGLWNVNPNSWIKYFPLINFCL